MKRLNVYELFKGYEDIYIPCEIEKNSLVNISLSVSEIGENSVLFVTEKVGNDEKFFDASVLKEKPLAIVLSESYSINTDTIPIIRAGSVRTALSYALSNSHEIDYKRMRFIGITGTNGKTTTATLISRILQDAGYKVGFIGTGKIISGTELLSDPNYSMTTPDPTILYPTLEKMSKDGCQYIVMEVSSHSIALGKIAPIKFEYAIFTNLDNDHLDFHKTKDEYFHTKLRLFESAKRGLFNLDDEYSRLAYNITKCEKSSFGIIYQGDAYATEIDVNLEQSSFYYREKNLICKVSINLGGAFNIYNSIAALKCAIDIGIRPCIAKRSLERISEVEGRMEIIKDDVTVIIDYAHTPSAFYNSLKAVKQAINNKQSLIAVFGCGGDRDPAKRPIFGKYAEMFADRIVITEDNSRNEDLDKIISEITCGMSKGSHKIIKDRECAIRYAINSANQEDVILILGKGHEKYKITQAQYVPFDEKKLVYSELERLHYCHEDKA